MMAISGVEGVATGSNLAALELPVTKLFINGEWRESADGGTFVAVNPTTEEPITEFATASAADVDAAVQAAQWQLSGGEWSKLSGSSRGKLLYRLAELVDRDAVSIAQLEALEVGRPVAPGMIMGAAETLRHFAGWADKIDGRLVSVPESGGRPRHCFTRREPVGVVGAITPWNAASVLTTTKLAPALATGCTIVLKPAEDAPLSVLHLASLVKEAGFPPGTINIIPGIGGVAGAALASHPGVHKISFTGSPEVGREIAKAAAQSFKRLTLELGGKSPHILFGDADLTEALPVVAQAFTFSSGQACFAGTRIIVERAILEEVVSELHKLVRAIPVGDPFEDGIKMGPLVSEPHLNRVLGYVSTGLEEGGELVTGGKRLERRGYFIEPGFFVGTNNLRIAQEEIFGPVATVIPFDEPDEAIAIANDSRYGLAAGIWTTDMSMAHLAAGRLEAGSVWVNTWGDRGPSLPFGGVKMSGLGRERSFTAIEAHTEEKAVTIAL